MLPVGSSLAQTGSISIVKEPVFLAGGSVYRQTTPRSSNMQKVAPIGSTTMVSPGICPFSSSRGSSRRLFAALTGIKSSRPYDPLPREPIPLQKTISASSPSPRSEASNTPGSYRKWPSSSYSSRKSPGSSFASRWPLGRRSQTTNPYPKLSSFLDQRCHNLSSILSRGSDTSSHLPTPLSCLPNHWDTISQNPATSLFDLSPTLFEAEIRPPHTFSCGLCLHGLLPPIPQRSMRQPLKSAQLRLFQVPWRHPPDRLQYPK
jgi:hypothetical protein